MRLLEPLDMPHYPVSRILNRVRSLRTLGFGVEHYPRYIHRTVNLHSVDVVLMSVIIRGRGKHIMGDAIYEERSGSVGITHYGQSHDILTSPAGMDIYNVYLDLRHHPLPPMPPALQAVAAQILPLHPQFRHQLNRSVHFQVRRPQRLAQLLDRLQAELEEKQPGHEDMARAWFRLFLVDCCREAQRSGIELTRPPDFPTSLERLRQRLDENYAARYSLSRLAREEGLSSEHLCRQFKTYTGKTLFEYLIERRIQAAMLRLRSTDEKILAIALSCGFSDISYFNRTFKRLTHQTPRAYRTAGA